MSEYSTISSVRLLIAMLKEHGIHQAVVAPGGSDIPIVHSLESDSYFKCYSVVDERSLTYFAMGLSQQLNEPVACVCTSGTAVSNFLSGIVEAYYQDVPLIAITADKDPRRVGDLELQNIGQGHLLSAYTKYSVDLPIIESQEDWLYCEELINKAFAEMRHGSFGPVQVNIPIVGNTALYSNDDLPKVRRLTIHEIENCEQTWTSYVDALHSANKILVIAGQNPGANSELQRALDVFSSKYNCCVSTETISNLNCKNSVSTYPVTEMLGGALPSALIPDLIISFGNNISSYNLKPFVRKAADKISHWQIDPAGRMRNAFNCLTDVFECSPTFFFNFFANQAETSWSNNLQYLYSWKSEYNKISIGEIEYSNAFVVQQLAPSIPSGSVVHCSILGSTRMLQLFTLKQNIRVFSNIGALGIDGCLSTFLGQAAASDSLAFLLIGDLSFFYDMNAAGIGAVGNNVRIVLFNNGGGSEFHFFMGRENIPSIDRNICAKHRKSAEGWLESLGYEYESVHNKDDLFNVIPKFVSKEGGPKVIEVFTDMENDANIIKDIYSSCAPRSIKSELRKFARMNLSTKQLLAIKRALNR